ncbi:unnamed protein product, partial [Ectocarpus sp. 8 AP-2014]
WQEEQRQAVGSPRRKQQAPGGKTWREPSSLSRRQGRRRRGPARQEGQDDERRGEGAAVETGFQVRGTGGGGACEGRRPKRAAAGAARGHGGQGGRSHQDGRHGLRLHTVQDQTQPVQQALQGPRARPEGRQGHAPLLRVHQLPEALLEHRARAADRVRELRQARHVEAVRRPAWPRARRMPAGQAVCGRLVGVDGPKGPQPRGAGLSVTLSTTVFGCCVLGRFAFSVLSAFCVARVVVRDWRGNRERDRERGGANRERSGICRIHVHLTTTIQSLCRYRRLSIQQALS